MLFILITYYITLLCLQVKNYITEQLSFTKILLKQKKGMFNKF